MTRAIRSIAIALAAVLSAACAVQPTRPVLPPLTVSPEVHQAGREQALAALTRWSLQGRVALSNGRDGGSGRLEWEQDGARYEVALSAPVTRQSWRLHGGAEGATLEGVAGGPRSGPDAAALLREATRWEIPVTALASWVRGVRADPARHGEAVLRFAPDGRLARLEQDGWTIEYDLWRGANSLELPGWLTARNGAASVRLVVDAWNSGTAP